MSSTFSLVLLMRRVCPRMRKTLPVVAPGLDGEIVSLPDASFLNVTTNFYCTPFFYCLDQDILLKSLASQKYSPMTPSLPLSLSTCILGIRVIDNTTGTFKCIDWTLNTQLHTPFFPHIVLFGLNRRF